jgi:hypothetical protein
VTRRTLTAERTESTEKSTFALGSGDYKVTVLCLLAHSLCLRLFSVIQDRNLLLFWQTFFCPLLGRSVNRGFARVNYLPKSVCVWLRLCRAVISVVKSLRGDVKSWKGACIHEHDGRADTAD